MTVPVRTTACDVTTPVARSLGRVSLYEGFEVRFGLPDTRGDWVLCSEFLGEPERFDGWRKALAEWLREQYGEAPDRTTAGYVMSWYLNVVGVLGGLLFHTERRVPSLRPADVAVKVAAEGRPHVVGVALLADEFACLPDDPEAGHPAATAVADETALAALLRARFAAHSAQFVGAFGPTVRLGRRMLWAAATDALDSAAWTVGQLCGDETAGVMDSALLLPAKLDPFTSASTLRATGTGWTRRRESCCFHFVLPNAEACTTCPRVC
ncbi:ferric iron reductase protein FhuF [Saccharothrix carnea]|uniref:Ferric iron reductase protein FhuF n=1 Tax=Saccharothrix carnea TaxID=1280637 RepID=A0A2P8IB66_SACCR|nr:(2Fe-2S)-binding protein [Saccharothrix carnea]PSL55708.1 ferric iron reductase protein FhuF [Saccharothrix carnea]